jgi:hypothetical protein
VANPNPRPSSRQELIDFCLRQLGAPVINTYVEDNQIEDAIDLALQYFQDFHSDGVERWYLKHQITQENIDNQYIPITENIIGVTRIFPARSTGQMVNMFDIQYQMRLNDMFTFTASSYVHYVMTQQHISTLDLLLRGEVPIRFNRHTDKLHIDWDWAVDATVDEWIIIEAFIIADPDTYTDVYNDRLLKRLATAYIKRQIGTNTKPYGNIPLPGGIMLNGKEIYDEAIEEIKTVEELIRTTHEPPPMWIMG